MSVASKLLDKTADELTVRDQLKLSAVAVTAFVGIPMLFAGAVAVAENISARRHAKKQQAQNTL